MDTVSHGNCNAMAGEPGSGNRSDLAILDCFDRPIAFHRCFVTLTGSVTAALMLSQAVYWQKRSKHEDGWWFKTRDDWNKETGMGRYEQESARKRLRQLGLLREDLRGVPAVLWYKVDEPSLLKAMARLDGPPATDRTVGGKPAIQLVENQPTRWRENHQQVGGKPANLLAGLPPTFKETKTTTEITPETTTTAAPSNARLSAGGRRLPREVGGSGSDDEQKTRDIPAVLLFDGPLANLDATQQERARRIVSPLDPVTAQQVLDDWGQALKTNSIQKSKWAWLEGVTRKARAGAFTPTTDAADRRQAEKRLKTALQAPPPQPLCQPLPPPENRPKGRPAGLQRLLQAVSPLLARAE